MGWNCIGCLSHWFDINMVDINMDELSELAKKYGTDKFLHGYTHIYDEKFCWMRNDVKKILEIGVEGGCSLKMWTRYFPNAHIYGVDILDIETILARIRVEIVDETEMSRISVITGDITDVKTIERIKRDVGNNIDIIIDDGSHLSKDQIFAFNELFLLLKDGGKGYYIIEDIDTKTGYGIDTVDYIKSLVKCSELVDNDSDVVKNLYSAEFFNNIIIIRKGKSKMVFYYR